MKPKFLRNERGAGAVEFALAAPVMLSMVIGVTQLGTLFQANAGIQHAIEEAARVAAVYPTPANVEALVKAKLQESRFGMTGTLTPVVQQGAADDGMKVLDISLTYRVPLDFIFFRTPPVTLSHSRRVFLQEAYAGANKEQEAAPPADSSGGGTASGGDSSGGATTSSGSTTPTSSGSTTPTSSGSTTPTSSGSTTPTSSGSTTPTSSGSTTPTSSGSTTPTSSGSTTPSSSGSTTPSSSGNGSSGNASSGGNTSSGNGNNGNPKTPKPK
jgi:Flp pilus assembly pilin Flp